MGEIRRIAVAKISPDPDQPRKAFDEGELIALAENMKAHGQQVPVIVYGSDPYMLLDGERRLRAKMLGGSKEIDALVLAEKPSVSALHVLQMSLEAHKVGLTAMERSNLLRRMQEENGWGVAELTANLHMRQPTVSKLLALQRLDADVQAMVQNGEVDIERAYVVSQEEPEKQKELLKAGLSREELRQRVRNGGAGGGKRSEEKRIRTARFAVAKGLTVSVQGEELDLSRAIEVLMEAVRELKKGQSQGLTIESQIRVMRDRARREP